MAREMGDASKVSIAGGDSQNLFYFYTGSQSYRDNSVENIAAFAQERFDSCKGKSVEEIESKHIFWGTEGPSFKGFYNGDTYVLFDDINKLPESVKQDAYANCKGYREPEATTQTDMKSVVYNLYDEFMAQGAWMGHAYGFENMREYYEPISDYMKKNGLDSSQVDTSYQSVVREFDAVSSDASKSFMRDEDTKKLEQLDTRFMGDLAHAAQMTADKLGIQDIRFEDEKTASPAEYDPVKIGPIGRRCWKEVPDKSGDGIYYRVGVTVPQDVSENGFANISVPASSVHAYKNGAIMLDFPDNKDINVDIIKDGKKSRESMVLSDLAEAHEKIVAEQKANRRLPSVPEASSSSKEMEIE